MGEPLRPVQVFFPDRSRRWVADYYYCRAGKLPGAVKVGKTWMIRESDLPGRRAEESQPSKLPRPFTVEDAIADLRRRGVR